MIRNIFYFKPKKPIFLDALFFLLISIFWFFFVFDTFSYLDPREISWFGIDNVTAYIAQLSYVSSDWKFPLLRNPDYGGPLSTSLTFTGPAPIIGLFMKLFNFNPEIQLFGLWILLNFFLQLVFGSRLLKILGVTANFARIFSVFFLSTFLALKAQGHFWLISHYLILWSLYILILYISHNTFNIVEVGMLLCLSYLTNTYLFAMVIAVILLVFVIRLLSSLESIKSILTDFSRLSALIFVIFLTFDGLVLEESMFQTAKTFVSSTYGVHGFNLLTFFNPDTGYVAEGFSPSDPETIVRFSVLPYSLGMIQGAYEGFMYLGLSVILGLLFLLFSQRGKPLLPGVSLNIAQKRAIIIFSGIVTMFAISYRIGIGSIEIVLPFPTILDHLLGIFRASGRFMWPFAYLLISLSVLTFYRWCSSRKKNVLNFIVIAAIFATQIIDTTVPLINQERRVLLTTNKKDFQVTELQEASKILQNYREIRAYPQGDFLENHYAELNYLAWRLGIPTDLHFTSRVNMKDMFEREEETFLHLCRGTLDPSAIYAVTNTSVEKVLACKKTPKPLLLGQYHTYFAAPSLPEN
jgi:hypothetical protein